jgi:hypothetical protein
MDPEALVPDPLLKPQAPKPAPDAEHIQRQDERLDEELDETFPASDPVPWRHERQDIP